jgi:hypothetical protein
VAKNHNVDETPLELREALHALLFEHPDGLTTADVAVKFALRTNQTQELLDIEAAQGLIDIQVDEVGMVIYKTNCRSVPVRDATSARVAYFASRSLRTKRAQRILFALCASITGCGVILGVAVLVRQTVASLQTNKTVTAEERVEAQIAKERRAEWTREAEDIEHRIAGFDAEAASQSCATNWSRGDTCYMSHRFLKKAEFDEERARMSLRAAEVRRLLER